MHFFSPDGTRLAYRRIGSGAPLVCVPGGPLLSADYLGDLGGLADHAELILLDHRGSGSSGAPNDPATYRSAIVSLTTSRHSESTWVWNGLRCSVTRPARTSSTATPSSVLTEWIGWSW
jgi:pimeloyl-ACP methyl ester carboxylesterase